MAATTMPLSLWVSVLAIVLVFLANAVGEESNDPMASAYKSLTEKEEKRDFLKYFLALGLRDWGSSQPRPPKFLPSSKDKDFSKTLSISPERIEKFENMNIPKESRKNLLEWTKKKFNLSTKKVFEIVKRDKTNDRKFFPDIGDLCCPW